MILEYIEKNGYITTKIAKEILELGDSRTREILKYLVDNAYLTTTGKTRLRKYYLKK